MPSALRTLPARLRESADGSRASEIKDLLTILRWHLPADSSAVLRDLVTRVQLVNADPLGEPEIDLFADEGESPLPAAMPVDVHIPARALRPSLAIAASVLLAIGVAGYAGYSSIAGFRTRRLQPAASTAPSEPAPAIRAPPSNAPAPIAPSRGFAARPLDWPFSGGAFSPSFASDGTSALSRWTEHHRTDVPGVAGRPRRGAALVPLLEERGRTYHARLSPDGIWVAFDSDRDGERGVYVASRNGARRARQRRWLRGGAELVAGHEVARLRARRAGPSEGLEPVAAQRRDRRARTRQSAFRFGQVWGASWFPGSRSIAYSHEDRLFIRDIAAGASGAFRSPIAGRLVRTPAVSPDGKRIVFQVHRDGAWLLDVKSGTMRRLLADPTAEEFAWDPDGTRIAYHSRRDGQWRIWLLTI